MDRADQALHQAVSAIDEALNRGDWDEAWEGAQAIARLIADWQRRAQFIRGHVVETYRVRDQRTLRYISERFGLTIARAGQLVQLARRGQEK